MCKAGNLRASPSRPRWRAASTGKREGNHISTIAGQGFDRSHRLHETVIDGLVAEWLRGGRANPFQPWFESGARPPAFPNAKPRRPFADHCPHRARLPMEHEGGAGAEFPQKSSSTAPQRPLFQGARAFARMVRRLAPASRHGKAARELPPALGPRRHRPPPITFWVYATRRSLRGLEALAPVATIMPAAPSSQPSTSSMARKRSRSTGPGSASAAVFSAVKPKRA